MNGQRPLPDVNPQRRPGSVFLLAAAVGFSVAHAATYTLVDLGTGSAADINNSGKVVGNDGASGWLHDGVSRKNLAFAAHPLGAPAEVIFNQTASSANAINDAGRITGHVTFPGPAGGTLTAYVFDGSEPALLMPTGDVGKGVNSSGLVVGGLSHPFTFDGVTETALAVGSIPRGVNSAGLIVGALFPQGYANAATFGAGAAGLLDLSGLALPDPGLGGYYTSWAVSVNTSGQIVGEVGLVTGAPIHRPGYAFLHVNGTAINLGALGGVVAAARDINDAGVIVGTSEVADQTPHAFVYVNGTMTDLNGLVASGGAGWVLNAANAINDAGMIVGEGTRNGETRAFLLKPSNNAVLPSITVQPVGASPFLGDPFQLTVVASGTPPLTYQWKHAGTNLPSATAATFSVAHATEENAGLYQVVVSSGTNSVTSAEAAVEVRVRPLLSIANYAGITVTGVQGSHYRIEAVENAGDSNWQGLDTVTVVDGPAFWVDKSTPQHPRRIYRAIQVQ